MGLRSPAIWPTANLVARWRWFVWRLARWRLRDGVRMDRARLGPDLLLRFRIERRRLRRLECEPACFDFVERRDSVCLARAWPRPDLLFCGGIRLNRPQVRFECNLGGRYVAGGRGRGRARHWIGGRRVFHLYSTGLCRNVCGGTGGGTHGSPIRSRPLEKSLWYRR